MFFFTGPIGLGHATRDVTIASKIGSGITFVSGGSAARLIGDYGFLVKDLYTNIGFDISPSGELKHLFRWLVGYWSCYRRCKKIAKNLINENKPKLVIADEDFAATAVALENKIPNVVITDVLETHFTKGRFTSTIEGKMNKAMKKMINNTSLVIIPEYGDNHDNIAHVGPIVREITSTRQELRKNFGFDRTTILVTVGGTDSGHFLIRKAIEAYNDIKNQIDAEMVAVLGPSLKIKVDGMRTIGYIKNLHEMIYASDLVISLAGRSTTDESSVYGTPGIFIPIKNHFEQEENARKYGYTFDDINRLRELIPLKLDSPRNEMKASNGEAKAADLITNLIK